MVLQRCSLIPLLTLETMADMQKQQIGETVINLARNMNDLKILTQKILDGSDTSCDELKITLDATKALFSIYTDRIYDKFQVDINPLIQLYNYTTCDKKFAEIIEILMELLKDVTIHLSQTSKNMVVPFLKQITRNMYGEYPMHYLQCFKYIQPDKELIQNYIRVLFDFNQDDQDEYQKYIQQLERMCINACINLQELLLINSISYNEELSLGSFTLFYEQNRFQSKFELEIPMNKQSHFLNLLIKLLQSEDEIPFALNLIQQYIDFGNHTVQYFTQDGIEAFFDAIQRYLNKFTQIEDLTQYFQVLQYFLIIAEQYNDLPVQNLNIQTVQNIQKLILKNVDNFDYNDLKIFNQVIKKNLFRLVLNMLEIKQNFSQECFKQLRNKTVTEHSTSFSIDNPNEKLDSRVSLQVFNFSRNIIERISFDQQQELYNVIVSIADGLNIRDKQFVYEGLMSYLPIVQNNDLNSMNQNLQIFEQMVSRSDLEQTAINNLLSQQDFCIFLQQMDDFANLGLIIIVYMLVNILPSQSFLEQFFGQQVPLQIQICLVDQILLAFNQYKFINMNEEQAKIQRREECYDLLQSILYHMSKQACIYHELVQQPKYFQDLCGRILYLKQFLKQIKDSLEGYVDFSKKTTVNDLPFIKRCIMIIKDEGLHELHYQACKIILHSNIAQLDDQLADSEIQDAYETINYDIDRKISILDIFQPILKYIQNAVGDYLVILTQIFIQIALKYTQESLQQLINLSQLQSEKILLIKATFQLLTQLKHKEVFAKLNVIESQNMTEIMKFLVQFMLISFYDDREDVQTVAFNQLFNYLHFDIGQLLNNCLCTVQKFITEIDNQEQQNLILDLLNSIEQNILRNGQIVISYIDLEVIKQFIQFYELNFSDEFTEENQSSEFYSSCQSFVYTLIIKITFSGQILFDTKNDEEEVQQYFTEYRFAEMGNIVNSITFQNIGSEGFIEGYTKINTLATQLAFMNAMKILQPVQQYKNPVFIQRLINQLVQILALVTSETLGMSIYKLQESQGNPPVVYNQYLTYLLDKNKDEQINVYNVTYGVNQLISHMEKTDIVLLDIQVLDIFDLCSKLLKNPGCSMDLRIPCAQLINALTRLTRNCVFIINGTPNQQQQEFWVRMTILKEGASHLIKEYRTQVKQSIIKLLETLSLGCLYQMQLKLQDFRYIPINTKQKHVYNDIISFDILKKENKNLQNVLNREIVQIDDQGRQLSKCINQLIHVFGHDVQQLKETKDEETERTLQLQLAQLPIQIPEEVRNLTQLQQAIRFLEHFKTLYNQKYRDELNTVVSALTFSSLIYLFNSDLKCFVNYLKLTRNIFESKVSILSFPHFIEFLENSNIIIKRVFPEIAFQASDCLIITELIDYCCLIYDSVVFEKFQQLEEHEIGQIKEICKANIANMIGLIIPVIQNPIADKLLQLSAFNYLIVFPFEQNQILRLTDVFGEEQVVKMVSISTEKIIDKFLQQIENRIEPEIYQYILNKDVFAECFITSHSKELQKCYEHSGQTFDYIPERYWNTFQEEFIQILINFLKHPLYFREIMPFQVHIAKFILKQRSFNNIQIFNLNVVNYLTRAQYLDNVDVYGYINDEINNLQAYNDIDLETIEKNKQIAQTCINYAEMSSKFIQNNDLDKTIQQNIEVQRKLIMQQVLYYMNSYVVDEYLLQKQQRQNKGIQTITQGIEMQERYYGVYVLFVRHLRYQCPDLYLDSQQEITFNLNILFSHLNGNPNIGINFLKKLKDELEQQPIADACDVTTWC